MTASRACALLALGACAARSYRYVDVPGPAGEARGRFEQRARELGFAVYRYGEETALAVAAPAPQAPAPQGTIRVLLDRTMADARFHALDPRRTRIEVKFRRQITVDGDADAEVVRAKADALERMGTGVTVKEDVGWSESYGIGIDAAIGIGVGSEPGHLASPRLDGALRIARCVHRFGEADGTTRARWSVVATPGLGFRVGAEAIAFRPEVLVSLARQPAAWFVPGRQLPTGPRTLFDLGLAGLIEDGGRRGLELGVSVRWPAWGGIYARAGVLSGSGALRGGPTFSAGFEIGTILTLATAAGGFVIAGAVASVAKELGVDSAAE